MSFTATQNKGFRMKFENGFAISVQWRTMNYCSKQTYNTDIDPTKERIWESTSAEVAVFDTDGEIVSIGDEDQIIGWLSPDEVAKVIEIVATAHTDIEIQVKLEVEKIIMMTGPSGCGKTDATFKAA